MICYFVFETVLANDSTRMVQNRKQLAALYKDRVFTNLKVKSGRNFYESGFRDKGIESNMSFSRHKLNDVAIYNKGL